MEEVYILIHYPNSKSLNLYKIGLPTFTISNIVINDYTVKLLYCKGSCNRKVRPLACRIFPLFPYVYEDNRISVKFDTRAAGTCPLLLTDLDGIYMSGVFRLMVYKTALALIDDPLISAYLIHLTKELETIGSFQSR